MNKTIKEYKLVLLGKIDKRDSETMLALIKEGWQPYGSPLSGNHGYIYQAMVKYEEPVDVNEQMYKELEELRDKYKEND